MRVVEVEGSPSFNGNPNLSFFHTMRDSEGGGGGRGPAIGTLAVPLEVGMDRYSAAERIAQAVTASPSLPCLEAAARGRFLVLHKLCGDGGTANPGVEVDDLIGVRVWSNSLGTDLDHHAEAHRAGATRLTSRFALTRESHPHT